jgi:hypothetical protein
MMVASSIFIIQPPYPGLTSPISICSQRACAAEVRSPAAARARLAFSVVRTRGRAAPLYRYLNRHATSQRRLLPHQEAGRVVMAAVIKI